MSIRLRVVLGVSERRGAAVMERQGVSRTMSFDAGVDALPDLTRPS